MQVLSFLDILLKDACIVLQNSVDIILRRVQNILKSLETSLICILLSASRDVHFDKRMICFLSVQL